MIFFVPSVLDPSISIYSRAYGFAGALLIALFFFCLGYLTRIHIGSNGVITTHHFLYIKGLQYNAKDIVAIGYGNLFKSGLGAGKGLNIIIKKNGREINTSIGEDLFGKEAIDQIYLALTGKELER